MASKQPKWPLFLLGTGFLGFVAATTSSGVIVLLYLLECLAIFVFLCYFRLWSGWGRISQLQRRCLISLIIVSPLILLFSTFWAFALHARYFGR